VIVSWPERPLESQHQISIVLHEAVHLSALRPCCWNRKRAASSTAGATQGAADQPLPQGETAAARADSRPQAKRRASEPAWTGISANGKPRTSAKAAAGNQRNNFVRINMKVCNRPQGGCFPAATACGHDDAALLGSCSCLL